MDKTLKPCEICGGMPKLRRESAENAVKPRKKVYVYECPKCGTRSHWSANTPNAAIYEWNNGQRRPEIMANKNFKDDPALQFITPEVTTNAEEHNPPVQIGVVRAKPTTSYKAMIKQVEARSKRLQCLIQPSLYEKIRVMAGRRGVSLNDLIHTTLEALAESED
jgi:hypothetical protein